MRVGRLKSGDGPVIPSSHHSRFRWAVLCTGAATQAKAVGSRLDPLRRYIPVLMAPLLAQDQLAPSLGILFQLTGFSAFVRGQ